jgi:hypothetical protein
MADDLMCGHDSGWRLWHECELFGELRELLARVDSTPEWVALAARAAGPPIQDGGDLAEPAPQCDEQRCAELVAAPAAWRRARSACTAEVRFPWTERSSVRR